MRLLPIVIAVVYSAAAYSATEQTIKYFGLSGNPPRGQVSSICYVDLCNNEIAKVNASLKESGAHTGGAITAFTTKHLLGLQARCDCVFKAWGEGVVKIPAYIFNDKYAVYGTNDVDIAKEKYSAYVGENNETTL